MNDGRIIVYVRGGVVQDVNIPENVPVTVEVRDYDVVDDGSFPLEQDEYGKHVSAIYNYVPPPTQGKR